MRKIKARGNISPWLLCSLKKNEDHFNTVAFEINFHYSSSGAPTGQTPAHVPHDMHAFASISYFPSPCFIHSIGHCAAQAPHEIHLSEILYAIIFTPFKYSIYILILLSKLYLHYIINNIKIHQFLHIFIFFIF